MGCWPLIALAGLLLAAPGALAAGLDAPLPPQDVQAEVTSNGVVVSWSPPLDEGAAPVLGYTVHRLTNGRWTTVGDVAANRTSFVDPILEPLQAYHVRAYNAHGSSPQSAPTTTAQCSPVGVGGMPPAVGINWSCIFPTIPGWPGEPPVELFILRMLGESSP